jgi:hypothetical protein
MCRRGERETLDCIPLARPVIIVTISLHYIRERFYQYIIRACENDNK